MNTERPQLPLLTVELRLERDVVTARQRARQLGHLIGFAPQDQARIATATSEVARNALRYAGGGRCEFVLRDRPAALLVRVTDRGPGIGNLEEILDGRYQSATGMGLGLIGTRRLMDEFEVESRAGAGTSVTFVKNLPPGSSLPRPSQVAGELSRAGLGNIEEDIHQADRELLRAVSELRARNEELEQIRGELEETNRGVVALYAELDEKAESLRKATDLKSRFLSNMSHEFRTPLNSIQSLSRILLDGSEGPLGDGQRRAVGLIRKSAVDLAEMVNDLLDLAKIEAGKIAVRPVEFDVAKLFGSLRGMIKPLVNESSGVLLVIEDGHEGFPELYGDEGKVQQILRNFASNALKFTERGEVRIGASLEPGGWIVFSVRDTGIGIAPEDLERIFEEFTQVDSPVQKHVKGTGLGLPLSRKLAQLLGGEILVESEPGKGSSFSLRLPVRFAVRSADGPAGSREVLAAVDDEAALLAWERFLDGTSYRLRCARTVEEARAAIRKQRPGAVIAGLYLGGIPTRPLLAELKKDPELRDVPVIGVTAAEHEARSLALGADVIVGKLAERHELLEILARAFSPTRRVLLIAPERERRDEMRSQLTEPHVELLEARDALEGLRRAREERPRAVVVDAASPGFAGEACGLLQADPATRALPILIRLSRTLAAEEASALSLAGARIVEVGALLRDEAGRRLREAVWKAGSGNA